MGEAVEGTEGAGANPRLTDQEQVILVYLIQERQPETVNRPHWTFITSHAAVLLSVERRPNATFRELAETVSLTERKYTASSVNSKKRATSRASVSVAGTTTPSTEAARCGTQPRWGTSVTYSRC